MRFRQFTYASLALLLCSNVTCAAILVMLHQATVKNYEETLLYQNGVIRTQQRALAVMSAACPATPHPERTRTERYATADVD